MIDVFATVALMLLALLALVMRPGSGAGLVACHSARAGSMG
jgi:hypothetical protein